MMRLAHARKTGRARWCAVASALLVSCVSAVAAASPEYPAKLQDELNMPCAPACTVCHVSVNGGKNTVTQPFGKTMTRAGLRSDDEDCIPKALAALANGTRGKVCHVSTAPSSNGADSDAGTSSDDAGASPMGFDSDDDGVSDIDELRNGENPNQKGGSGLCVVKYGCGARVAPNSASDHPGVASIALAGIVLAWASRLRLGRRSR